MWQNAHDTYLESRVLSASPVELVRMLYQSADQGVKNARRHLAAGDIAARARSISHVSAVLIELVTSLDHERGGAISTSLAQLYDYMLRRLTEANLQQTDPPLAEVERLLGTLLEGWEGIAEPKPAVPEAWEQPALPGRASPYASPWNEPQPEPPAERFERSCLRSGDALPAGNPWAPASDAWTPAASDSGYGGSWAQLAAQESVAAHSAHDWSF
ncbi:MAG TPA: flagellar export chaperone FliS [Bryobacteraceae bacterium]|nr:flagellar export chaperone FliS [Bryobacteraceae bacterium]